MIHEAYELVKEEMDRVERELRGNLTSPIPIIPQVGEYMFLSGGKRFRPLLLILCCRLAGYQGDRYIPLACTVEFLHTATLLHDDVVDKADIRRGKASANSIWGNQASVLIGDFLLARSLSLLVADSDPRVLRLFCHTTEMMAEGEVMQLLQTCDPSVTEEDYLRVAEKKTASLISASCQVGAILGGLSHREEEALATYGMNLGVAFQIVDDALDYVSTSRKFGKERGTDLKDGKMTLPLIHLLRHASGKESAKVRELIERGEMSREEAGWVMGLVERYGGVEYARARAREFAEICKGELPSLPQNIFRQILKQIPDYVVEREA